MPDYRPCPDCGEGIFKLVTKSGRRIQVDGERSPNGDIAIVGNLALTLDGDRLDAARAQRTPLHEDHRRTCRALEHARARARNRFKRARKQKKKAKHGAI